MYDLSLKVINIQTINMENTPRPPYHLKYTGINCNYVFWWVSHLIRWYGVWCQNCESAKLSALYVQVPNFSDNVPLCVCICLSICMCLLYVLFLLHYEWNGVTVPLRQGSRS